MNKLEDGWQGILISKQPPMPPTPQGYKLYHLNLPKSHYQLGIKCSSDRDYGEQLLLKASHKQLQTAPNPDETRHTPVLDRAGTQWQRG